MTAALEQWETAIAVLEAAPTHPATGSAPRVVLALALHSAGRSRGRTARLIHSKA